MNILRMAGAAYAHATSLLNRLQSPLLLCIRLFWGWQFSVTGWGKLQHLDKVTDYFTSLGLPMPHTMALSIGLVEFAGGILFALGMGTRIVSLVLFLNMTAAFWVADRDAFLGVFSAPDKFYGADPFTFWFAALLILVLGSGVFAIDEVLKAMANRFPESEASYRRVAN